MIISSDSAFPLCHPYHGTKLICTILARIHITISNPSTQSRHSSWIHQSCRDLARQWRELSYGSVGELSWYSSLYCRVKSSSKATGAKLSSLAGHNVKGAPYLAPPRGPSHPVQPVHLYRHGATSIWEIIKQHPPFKDVKIAYLKSALEYNPDTHLCSFEWRGFSKPAVH